MNKSKDNEKQVSRALASNEASRIIEKWKEDLDSNENIFGSMVFEFGEEQQKNLVKEIESNFISRKLVEDALSKLQEKEEILNTEDSIFILKSLEELRIELGLGELK